MLIKKCDVCKSETDALYDKMIATHTDTINNIQYIRQNKLHICRTCLKSITDGELEFQLGWYEDNIKEENNTSNGDNSEVNNNVEDNPNENEQGDSEDAGGTTTGE